MAVNVANTRIRATVDMARSAPPGIDDDLCGIISAMVTVGKGANIRVHGNTTDRGENIGSLFGFNAHGDRHLEA